MRTLMVSPMTLLKQRGEWAWRVKEQTVRLDILGPFSWAMSNVSLPVC